MTTSLSCLYTILLLALLSACKSPAPMTISHPDRLEFGSFGGFAGSYTEYKVVPDGQAWMQERHKGPIVNLQPIDIAVFEQMTTLIKQSQEQGYTINDPGNMTYFIRYRVDGQEPYELIWGGGNQQIDAKIKSIHKTLTKLCKEDHPKM